MIFLTIISLNSLTQAFILSTIDLRLTEENDFYLSERNTRLQFEEKYDKEGITFV